MPKVNAYLPADLHKQAKLAGLPLSRMLQNAVERELDLRRIAAGIRDQDQGQTHTQSGGS